MVPILIAGLTLGEFRASAQSTIAGNDPLEKSMKAVDRGLEYLASTQDADGGWTSSTYGKTTAMSGLALMAFMARGHTPGRGQYAELLERGTTFLVAHTSEQGLVALPGNAPPMYQHGLGTLALAELYGMSRRADIKPRLEAAVNLIVRCQNTQGGWRYQPVKADADMSVTVMQIVALKAAMNAGIKVPETTLRDGIKYVKSSACAGGGFGYTPGAGPGIGASPAGTLSLQMCGEYETKEVKKGLEHQAAIPVTYSANSRYFYANYYAAQAMNQAGGRYWMDWMPKIRAELLNHQAKDGSWPNDIGPVFSTAISCLILSVDCHYLPIYQR